MSCTPEYLLRGDAWVVLPQGLMIRKRAWGSLPRLAKRQLEHACMLLDLDDTHHAESPYGPYLVVVGLHKFCVYDAGLCSTCVDIPSTSLH